GGTNLGGPNLGGTNLGGTNLGGTNLGGTNLGGVNLTTPNIGLDIHGTGNSGMLFSGEDLWSPGDQNCVVVGIGSTAFPRLLAQNSGPKLYAAVRQLPWGFTSTAGGAVELYAWEALVWGSNSYCSFILAAPPTATFTGVVGFVKAVFR